MSRERELQLALRSLDNFQGVKDFGLKSGRAFLTEVKKAYDAPPRINMKGESIYDPVVVMVGGRPLVGKTRFTLALLAALDVNDVDMLFWVDTINVGKKIGTIDRDRQYGQLLQREFNNTSHLFESGMNNAIISAANSERRKLIIGESPTYTGIPIKHNLKDDEELVFPDEEEELVQEKEILEKQLKEKYGYDVDLSELLLGRREPVTALLHDRALSVTRNLSLRRGKFKGKSYKLFIAALDALPAVRERGLANRMAMYAAQSEDEILKAIRSMGLSGDLSGVNLFELRPRLGGPLTAIEAVDHDLDLVLYGLSTDEHIDLPLEHYPDVLSVVKQDPHKKLIGLVRAYSYFMNKMFKINPRNAFIGIQQGYEEGIETRDITALTNINEKYMESVFGKYTEALDQRRSTP